MRIPPPPNWLLFAVAATLFILLAMHPGHSKGAMPYYTGKPPPSGHYPGRCWCAIHGPRGGCIKWICNHARS